MIKKTYAAVCYKVYTIKTDKFKTAHMEVIFRKKATRESLPLYTFLADMLSESTKKYPSKKDLVVEFEKLYLASINAQTSRTGTCLNFSFILDFINPSYIKDDNYLENIIKLLMEVIHNPNVTNEEFDLKTYNFIKDKLHREIDSLKENPAKWSIRKALSYLGESASSYTLLGSHEDIDKVTPSTLYKAYQSLFKDFTCDVFIIGDFDMDHLVSLFKENFSLRVINETKLDLLVNNEPVKKEKVYTEKSDNVQASLVMLYNVDNTENLDRDIYMNVFNYLFGSGGLNSVLYQNLREKNSMCYAVSSMYLKYDKLLLIQVSLESKNVEKAISLVKKSLKEMQRGEFTEDALEEAKKNMQIALDFVCDNQISLLDNYIFNVYAGLPLVEKRQELFGEVTLENVVNISKKIKLNTILVLEGREN